MARSGYRPSMTDAVHRKCCDCMTEYADHRRDCRVRDCPLYPRHRFRKRTPNLMWLFGKWSKTHRERRIVEGLTKEEYIKKFIVKPGGKFAIGMAAMIRAKCYRCCGDFLDGRADCNIRNCSLYYWMPYRDQDPEYDWLFDTAHTSTHRNRMKAEGLARDQYVRKYIGKEDIDTPHPKRVRIVAGDQA